MKKLKFNITILLSIAAMIIGTAELPLYLGINFMKITLAAYSSLNAIRYHNTIVFALTQYKNRKPITLTAFHQ